LCCCLARYRAVSVPLATLHLCWDTAHNLPRQPSEVSCGRRMDDLFRKGIMGHISRVRALNRPRAALRAKQPGPIPSESVQAPSQLLNYLALHSVFWRTQRINRMSSKYIVPAPPAASGLPFVPKPMVMVLTLVRSTPANSVRSITHSFHPVIWVAASSG